MTETVKGFRSSAQRAAWLAAWAEANGCYFDAKGEVGFGRECVGVGRDGKWLDVDFGSASDPLGITPSGIDDGLSWPWYGRARDVCSWPELSPFREPQRAAVAPDAYHKHDCLAVLGRGAGAVRQLFEWTFRLVQAGAFVETLDRDRQGEPYAFDGGVGELLHGRTRSRLTFVSVGSQRAMIETLRVAIADAKSRTRVGTDPPHSAAGGSRRAS